MAEYGVQALEPNRVVVRSTLLEKSYYMLWGLGRRAVLHREHTRERNLKEMRSAVCALYNNHRGSGFFSCGQQLHHTQAKCKLMDLENLSFSANSQRGLTISYSVPVHT
jgi:hypothetical protein